MRITFYLILALLTPALSFSQNDDKDVKAEHILDSLCNNKFFEKCEVPVDFKFGKKALEDSLTKYVSDANSILPKGTATFRFIVAKDGKVYNVEKIAGEITSDGNIVQSLNKTSDMWTIGKQNSRLICSYVRLEVEVSDSKIRVNLLKR